MAEQQLDGGIANAGQVVRVGPHVLRPSSPHSGSIHAFLRAVRHAGFEGASSPVGIDEDGRERLVFIDGDVPLAPYPDWSQSDAALASIARLLRGLHDAARGFDPRGLTWNDALADPAGGALVCHNDVEPPNVVFRDGIAVALLDFEFAAPGRPVYDLAHLARLCVPIDDDVDQARLGWRPADRPARLRLVADAYGLDRDGRAELLSAMDDAIDRIEAAVRRSVDAGDPNAVEMWNRTGGGERYDRRRRWWTDHRRVRRRPPLTRKRTAGAGPQRARASLEGQASSRRLGHSEFTHASSDERHDEPLREGLVDGELQRSLGCLVAGHGVAELRQHGPAVWQVAQVVLVRSEARHGLAPHLERRCPVSEPLLRVGHHLQDHRSQLLERAPLGLSKAAR